MCFSLYHPPPQSKRFNVTVQRAVAHLPLDLPRKALRMVPIMGVEKRLAHDFMHRDQVVNVRSGMVLARIAFAARYDGPQVAPVDLVSEADLVSRDAAI